MTYTAGYANHSLTSICEPVLTVQGGTPMTVTGNGILLRFSGRDVSIFCLKISSGVRGQTAPGLGRARGGRP